MLYLKIVGGILGILALAYTAKYFLNKNREENQITVYLSIGFIGFVLLRWSLLGE